MGLLLQVGIVIYIIEANIREESERMLASAYWDWIRKLFGINEQVFKKARVCIFLCTFIPYRIIREDFLQLKAVYCKRYNKTNNNVDPI